ncbi:MAG: hypothetical protein Q9170_001870 [Blastenia crenularia]
MGSVETIPDATRYDKLSPRIAGPAVGSIRVIIPFETQHTPSYVAVNNQNIKKKQAILEPFYDWINVHAKALMRCKISSVRIVSEDHIPIETNTAKKLWQIANEETKAERGETIIGSEIRNKRAFYTTDPQAECQALYVGHTIRISRMAALADDSQVLVVFAGLIKLAHTHWKLRKYTALARTRAAQKEEEGLQRVPSAVRRKKGNDVPFGVRAIESGIEVDGVWISRSNTPANSTPGSPALSADAEPTVQNGPTPDRASTTSNMSRLEIPQPAHGHPRPNSRSTNSTYTRVSGNPFERSVSSERSPSRLVSTYSELPPRGRPSYQPRRSSHLRFSNSHTIDNAEALATLEGRQLASKTGSKSSEGSAEYETSEQRNSDDSWSGSSGDIHRQNAGHPPGTNYRANGLRQPIPVNSSSRRYRSSDLDSLASHRKSHAAETGQLFPRVKATDSTGEWAGVQQPAEHRNFLSGRSSSPIGSSNDPFKTPQGTPMMTPSQESSRGAPSFEEFVRSTSPQGQYFLGEEGIPLQQQSGDTQGGRLYGPETPQQAIRQPRHEHDLTGRKTSSFSEAV